MARDSSARRGGPGAHLPLWPEQGQTEVALGKLGSSIAAVLWLAFSAIYSWYTANFGTFNATYGSLGAAIGFMLWMWLSTTVILLGGKLNAEIEHQTARDSTEGPQEPIGQRHAHVADTVGPNA
jgi:membrane protein